MQLTSDQITKSYNGQGNIALVYSNQKEEVNGQKKLMQLSLGSLNHVNILINT